MSSPNCILGKLRPKVLHGGQGILCQEEDILWDVDNNFCPTLHHRVSHTLRLWRLKMRRIGALQFLSNQNFVKNCGNSDI